MSCDVEIRIFGKVSEPEAIWELGIAAADEGMVDWVDAFGNDEFVGMLEQAATEGRALTLTRSDTKNLFESVTTHCQEAGLSYVLTYGKSGAEGFTNGVSWHPEMEREYEFTLDGENATLKLSDVRKAAKQGIDAVNALVDRITAHTRIGKVEIEHGFGEALQAYLDSGEAWCHP